MEASNNQISQLLGKINKEPKISDSIQRREKALRKLSSESKPGDIDIKALLQNSTKIHLSP